MGNTIDYFLSPSLAMVGSIILVIALGLTVLLRDRLKTLPRRIFFFLSSVSFGCILQVTLLREPPRGSCLECLGQWGFDNLSAGRFELDTALNVALFVPLGLFSTLLWRSPFRVVGMAALISLVIEVIQPLIGTGANDIADIVANTFGAFIGAGVATTILLVCDSVASRHLDLRRAATLLIGAVVAIGIPLVISVGGANAIQAAGARELDDMFGGTTLADYRRQEDAWTSRIETFWAANRWPTVDSYSDADVALQRFAWSFYGTTRCVTARWDVHGFTTVPGSDGQCTQRLQ